MDNYYKLIVGNNGRGNKITVPFPKEKLAKLYKVTLRPDGVIIYEPVVR